MISDGSSGAALYESPRAACQAHGGPRIEHPISGEQKAGPQNDTTERDKESPVHCDLRKLMAATPRACG